MQFLSATFNALNKEAQFTQEMLGSGATQIRNANYASKGRYFQAFTSLSTGLERIGKLCLMLDHYISHNRQFPNPAFLKDQIRHNLAAIYQQSKQIIDKYSIEMRFQGNLDDSIHQAIVSVLSEFAKGDRYSNIDLLVGTGQSKDPIASWFRRVDEPLYQTRISKRGKDAIERNAAFAASVFGEHATVLHTSETGDEITDLEEASRMTGIWEAVAPYRQLYVVQVIRYWAELLISLGDRAMKTGSQDIPFLSEIFALFCNEDAYMRTRKNWDRVR